MAVLSLDEKLTAVDTTNRQEELIYDQPLGKPTRRQQLGSGAGYPTCGEQMQESI